MSTVISRPAKGANSWALNAKASSLPWPSAVSGSRPSFGNHRGGGVKLREALSLFGGRPRVRSGARRL